MKIILSQRGDFVMNTICLISFAKRIKVPSRRIFESKYDIQDVLEGSLKKKLVAIILSKVFDTFEKMCFSSSIFDILPS